MANSKVSALSAKTAPVAADSLYIIDSSDTSSKKCTITQFLTGTPLTIGATGTATTFAGTITAAEAVTVTTGGLTVSAGGLTVSDGPVTLIDNSNAAGGLTFRNDTITTFGNGATEGQGAIVFASNTLTTGNLVRLELDESALNGGAFLKCVQTDGSAAVFTVAENGATTIAGASAGTGALTLTAGDLTLTSGHLVLTSGNATLTAGNFTMTVGDASLVDGSLTIVDADNAVSLSVTNSTATTASIAALIGAGAFTGSTTASFFTITPSGLTTGTAVYLPLAAITEGKGLHITSGASQTTASLLYVQDTGANCAITSGTAATFDLTATAITGTVNKIGSGVSVTSSRTTTTGIVADDFDLLSIVRTDIINGAGSMSAAGSVIYIENAVTNTSGAVTDTVNGVEVVMDSLGTGDGVKVTHSAVTGKALNIVSSATTAAGVILATANALTEGQVLKLASSATAITNTGRIFLSSHTGNAGVSAVLNEFTSAAADETTVLRVTASAALALGVLLDLSGAAITTGTVLDMGGLDALVSGTGLNIVSNSADATARVLLNIKNDHASATGASPLTITNDSTGACLTASGALQSTNFQKIATTGGVTL
ncbi:MAG: hypothetical protein WC346_09970, partial [Methanogenium sp.]